MVVMLKLPKVRCTLRKGCIIIGALWLVFSVLVIVGALLAVRKLEQIEIEEYQHYTGTVTPELRANIDFALAGYRAFFYVATTIAVMDTICSTMLILGVCWNRPHLVLPWVMQQLGVLPIRDLLGLAFAVLCYMTGHLPTATVTIIVLVVLTGTTLYFILVVYGLYRYLRGKQVPTHPIRAR
ncbi:uncharacterized protein LOC124717065 [Schistocerca piceifrons]|uniref:uncharacterized protein LOC124717065 n=1 Tax=Schistocerca piceifrons TaxID=274613 RepID=UPI001F5FDBBF|nr:uncharacterized protein LOC124717065 [Schistocerca piceifrons]